MIRIIYSLGFVATLIGIALHYRTIRASAGEGGTQGQPTAQAGPALLAILSPWAYRFFLISFVLLGITGYGPWLVLGAPLSGFVLMAHMVAAPVFAICLAYLAVVWAYRYRWGADDAARPPASPQADLPREGIALGEKISFWLVILLALPVILTAVLGMFPLFGTPGQVWLLNAHRASAMLLVMATLVDTYLAALRHRRG